MSIGFRHADHRYPFLWESNAQSAGRWHADGEGPVQYLADTPTGRFVMNRQIDGVRVGQLGTLYRPKYFHPDGIAFHGYTSVPPYPASHGCVRLTTAAINFVWDANIIPLGTAVWVY